MVLNGDCGVIQKSKSGKGLIIIDRSRPIARKFTCPLKRVEELLSDRRKEVPIAEIVWTEECF